MSLRLFTQYEMTLTSVGSKRKASEPPGSPSAAKRVKHGDDDDAEAVDKKGKETLKRIPFPEKVRNSSLGETLY